MKRFIHLTDLHFSHKDKTQNVKRIVEKLKENRVPEGLKHSKVYRPWGNYESLVSDKRWQVRVDEEGKFHWFDTKHMYGKYTVEEILEAMDKINGVQKSE